MIGYDNIKNLYFLGIGGIGMSALARYALNAGHVVAGYDLTETELTRALQSEGISVHYSDDPKSIPTDFSTANTLVVRTPAVPADHAELNYLQNNKYKIIKRSELLGYLTSQRQCIAVAGTHGKTSVSTMISFLLSQSGIDTGAFLGGISRNFNSNLLLSKNPNSLVVTEADEFDRSFLQLSPNMAVITSMDADHLDIYQDHQSVTDAFGLFINKIKSEGTLIAKEGLDVKKYLSDTQKLYTYSIDKQADFMAINLCIKNGAYHFDIVSPLGKIENVRLNYPGRVNVENMLAAIAVAMLCQANNDKIKVAVANYLGVQRRFDIQFKNEQIIYIDDYAHHPEELKATILSIRELYAGKKVLGIFQPHLYSRTRDFAEGFAQSLDLLDESILLAIYPAREKPIEGVTSQIIFEKMKSEEKTLATLNQIPDILKEKKFDILVTMGAGSIDTLAPVIKNWLNNNTIR